jgi:hypothetical protein
MKQPRFRPNRWRIRGLLVLGIEIMALSSLLLRDLVLAAMLQVLAVLVLSVHQLDRRLPTVADRADEAARQHSLSGGRGSCRAVPTGHHSP